MEGIKDRLGDLSWLGIKDQAWFEVEVPDPVIDQKLVVDNQISLYLKESLPMVAADDLSITKKQRSEWIEYRIKIKEIPLQPGYPNEIYWPKKPE